MAIPKSAADIRAQFPHPKRANGARTDARCDYCVGGAFIAYVDEKTPADLMFGGWDGWHFPGTGTLMTWLLKVNPEFDGQRYALNVFADNIISRNDRGDYRGAWRTLDAALAWCEGMSDPRAFIERD